jgi:hypothetical protein
MKIHLYPTTDAAQDARYKDYAKVNEYDILVIESEGVVGVAMNSPFAVTAKRGDLSEFCHDWPEYDFRKIRVLTKAIDFAVAEATRRGFEVDPQFILTLDEEPVSSTKLNLE